MCIRDRIIIGSIFLHIPLGAGNFEVLWAVNERGFTSSEYNSLFGIFFIIGGSIGAVMGGVLSDKLSYQLDTSAVSYDSMDGSRFHVTQIFNELRFFP